MSLWGPARRRSNKETRPTKVGYVTLFDTLHKVEFKRPKDVADYLIDDYSPHRDLWDEYLWRILDSASNCDTEQELNDHLAWALLDAPAGNN